MQDIKIMIGVRTAAKFIVLTYFTVQETNIYKLRDQASFFD
jgi:hypothetical protein